MKKNLIILLMLLAFTPVLGVEQPAGTFDPASLVPSTAVLYAQTARIDRALQTARYVMKNFLPEKNSKEVNDWSADFSKKTGVDPLDAASLAKAGVDTGRSAYFTYLASEQQSERIILFIPVKNEKAAPLKFVDILKKYNKAKPGLDLNPVITRYKNRAVYQILKDVFFTAMDGHLVIASSGNLLQGIIDREEGAAAAGDKAAPAREAAAVLADDPVFRDYRDKAPKCNDLGVFIGKDFIDEKYKAQQKKQEAAQGEEGTKEKKVLPSEIDFLEYMVLGLNRQGEGISVQFGVSLKKGTPTADILMKLFRPIVPEHLLSADGVLSYHFLSMDLQALEKVCGDSAGQALRMCAEYKKFKAGIEKESGISLERDFIPYFGGYINMAARKSKIAGTMDNFILYVPMSDEGKTRALWKALRSTVKEKYSGEDEFGEEKIDAVASFWYKDKKENKISFVEYEKGLYVGNNIEFLRLAMSGKKDFPSFPVIECPESAGAGIVLLSYLKMDNESYLKALLQLLTYNVNPQLYGLINRIDTLSLTGKRADNYYSFNLTTVLLPEKGK